jgi:hypothetical protein
MQVKHFANVERLLGVQDTGINSFVGPKTEQVHDDGVDLRFGQALEAFGAVHRRL